MPRGRANCGVLAIIAGIVSGCATSSGVATPDTDVPLGHELLGFHASGAMIVRSTRLDHRGPLHTLEAVIPPKGPARVLVRARTPIQPRDGRVEGTAWQPARPAPAITTPAIEASETPRVDGAIAAWPAVASLPFTLVITTTTRLFGRDTVNVVASLPGAHTQVVVVEAPIVGDVAVDGLHVSPDARWAVVSLRIGGRPGLHVIDVRATHAALLVRAGLAAYHDGDWARARATLERAIDADPTRGDAMYDLACLDALAGAGDAAVARLRTALAINPVRYRRLAREDPDLAAIVGRPEICPLLSTCPRGGESITKGPR